MAGGPSIQGRISWFGGPHDSSDSGHTASGGTTAEPGIAVYNHATLGGYWRVRMPNGRSAVVRQTDIGPAPSTGRKLDFTYSVLPHLGYSEGNFPTNAEATAEYLGRNAPQGGGGIAPSARPGAALLGGQGSGGGSSGGLNTAALEQLVAQLSGAGKSVGPTITPLRAPAASAGPTLPEGFQTPAAGVFATPQPKVDSSAILSALAALTGSGAQSSSAAPTSGANAPSLGASGYVNPLGKGFSLGRTDQGVDASAAPGTPIRAIGNAKVLGIQPNWFKGQPYVYYQLLDGPQKGKVVYVAEQISPNVKAGQTVRAGQQIGTYASSGTGIETGFGTPSGSTLARSTTGYTEGQATPAGQQFLKFLRSLGVR